MINKGLLKKVAWTLVALAISANAWPAATDIASAPLITSASTSVKPNLMFVLDDSGSMDWDYLPDWANSNTTSLFANSDYNSIYYNPAITYTPPLKANGTSWPSQTTWTAVRDDAYQVQSTGTTNLVGNAYYYVIIPGEYCSTPALTTCVAQASTSAAYPYPAKLRWCNSAALTTCKAVRTSTYSYPRYPMPASATIKVTSATNAIANSIKVNGLEILSGSTASSSTANTVADRIAQGINDCTNAITGNCQVTGYSATRSASTVTVTAPDGTGAITYTPVLTKTNTLNTTISAFSGGIPGSVPRVDIKSAVNSYPYPGTAVKASTRTDCAGSTCTYAEEMTNYANWWTYYHTRMQMMKSSAAIAFGAIDSRYRVGYLSLNNNTAGDFLNVTAFDSTQKTNWYTKLTNAIPSNSTPLRQALSTAGRMFGGKLNGTTLNGSTVVDPVQYSCQQNFTILSTDGYWNGNGGTKLDGSAIGDHDNALSRPRLDGTSTSGTLADVAAYYYNTDLRTTSCTSASGSDVCNNNVPTSGLDAAAHQHMTTFTVGLGVPGFMLYSPSYSTATSGDFFDVKNGTAANPAAGVCSWQASGTCNWPVPSADSQANIDDLWHAAVNGFGTYFSAGNPAALSSGLSDALAGVSARTGDSAAATTSNPNVATGDNFVFSSTFTSVEWDGELVRQQMDLTTGVVSNVKDWTAQAQLDTNSARTIYTFDPGSASKLKIFSWANLTAAERAFFTTPNISSISQFCASGPTCLTAASQTAASGASLVSFLTGDRTNEGAAIDISKYYRQRVHVLGDIVNSEAVYVKAPPQNYADSGYSGFKSGNAGRQGMVYVAANDGMLHAFNATTGVEVWAYVPSLVLSNLYKLSDKNYTGLHQYSVDGTPAQADVYYGGAWHTILVGGLNGGGRGYYALDITDPTAPKALWEFTYDTSKSGTSGYTTDANLGYTFGKPEITKLKNGTWVVLVTSGYNNVSPGDGRGYLYVLNAGTGELIRSISTGVGSTASIAGVCSTAPCPSGLAQVRAWADNSMTNNTALRVYGGDLFGNLWRFDINGDVGAAGYDAQLLATLRGPSGNIQPVTTKPELGDVSGNAVVYVGTGRYMGVTDLTDTSRQTLYAIKDALGSSGFGNPRADGSFVQQTMTATTCPPGSPDTICTQGQSVRTSTNLTVNFASQNGWYIDLPDSGERANTDPQLALGTISYTTNVPNTDACTSGGYSFFYFFDYRTGGPVSTSTTSVVGKSLGNALSTRPVFARLPNNKVIGLIRLSDGSTITSNVPIGNSANTVRRVSWRELPADQ
ncbi:hypothetical protein EGT07_09945 [Herbaspirillum sp. HC18]|nr:hypothetical protein EGT07_09945 [Herbaspirillum sp. HC18]